ncbi:hypothetical protein [Enterococcus sp. CWB-B31]|uniref:hypothetical protein n=1 Tax=Enterococcus sp. CWB-B31 TaxID=2885159 RepID=UPI001E3AC6E0|nr:hypothetical protein [Enterococcus sp. CWB-B31]MCB5954263.1 hypothetical protein [Enterococcus sp. CWB-B31]
MNTTKNKQPIKEISHQDIYSIVDLWERLKSWEEVLIVLEKFFEGDSRPLNKQLIVRRYYAYSQVFTLFYLDFSQSIQEMESQLVELRQRKKV